MWEKRFLNGVWCQDWGYVRVGACSRQSMWEERFQQCVVQGPEMSRSMCMLEMEHVGEKV